MTFWSRNIKDNSSHPITYRSIREINKNEYSISMDGVDDNLAALNNTIYRNYTSITLECDFLVHTLPTAIVTLMSKGRQLENTHIWLFIDVSSGNYRLNWETGDGSKTVTRRYTIPGFKTNTWYHVAATYEATQWKIFLNGSEVATFDDVTYGDLSPNNYIFYIGRYSHVAAYFFDGKIDNVRIWDRVRTPAQISSNWNREIDYDSLGLAGLYKFNEGSGTMTYNSSTSAVVEGTYLNLVGGAGFNRDVPR